ncbi:MAG: fused MFS/spermidine synthase [Clostridiales bacterium]|nr:fused MFS/spermidine synthase [Roseburia sp.]MDD7637200.1 fused MFS/spermidine synthase [Clostridiales bacterium]
MQHDILKNKYYLYMTEFFAGMSVMAVELGASRLLAPYFSSSQIVWTIIIGTIMIAMALGNVWGGRRADKDPNPDKLYLRLIVAAVWIAAIPLLGKYIVLGISGILVLTVNTNFLIWAAFLACMVIFVFPLFLLGTVTPSLVKYTVDSLSDSGKTVGTLGAFNTIGSIIGTFLPTFVTIPVVGTAVTFLIFSGILLVLALIYFINTKTKKVPCIVGAAAFLICSIFGHSGSFAFWENDLVYEGESVYNYLQVKEDEADVILSTNVLFGVQSILKKEEGLTGMYYDYALAAPVMAGIGEKENLEVLILGMGTGTFARQCRNYFDDVVIEGVEIDEKIIGLSYEYFELPEDIPVVAYDGRAYLNAVDKKYDVIMVDAYQDITIPFQMSTEEFFTMVKEHLTEDGIMVVNMNMHTEKEGNINQYLSDTIAKVFPEVYTVDVAGTTNRELFASVQEGIIEGLEDETKSLNNVELKGMIQQVADHMQCYEKGNYLLTDDKAPVELLGMQVIDELIQSELGYYKGIFKEDGIRGILESM